MARVVHKYGGSSVADLDKLQRVAARIAEAHAAGHEVVAVVSAMGNTTDELLALARAVAPRPDRRELDMLISVGERVSMALLAMALRELEVPAVSLTGSQSGIITDEAHAEARVVEVRPARLRAVLASGRVAIVAGFQGVSRDREVTTLGRGGSDTTAVVLAAALEADWCEICSDVDGLWSADPRLVPAARKLPELSVEEALALSRGGARVLYEEALRYARDHGLSLRARSAFGPGSGTRITAGARTARGPVAVSSDVQLLRLRIGPEAPEELLARLRSRLIADGIVWVDERNAHGMPMQAPGVQRLGPGALVSVVGSGLGRELALARRAWALLHAAGLEPSHMGARGDSLWFALPVEQAQAAVARLHQALIERPRS